MLQLVEGLIPHRQIEERAHLIDVVELVTQLPQLEEPLLYQIGGYLFILHKLIRKEAERCIVTLEEFMHRLFIDFQIVTLLLRTACHD